MTKLTTKARKHIKDSNFALPGRRYPIHDMAHARAALSMVAKHGTPAEQEAVRKAVYSKYPHFKKASNKYASIVKQALSVQDPGSLVSRPVSATLGRLNSIPALALIGSDAALASSPRSTDPEIAAIIKEYENDPRLKNVTIQLGESHPMDNISRIAGNPNTSTLSKILGLAALPGQEAMAAVGRADNYNPFSNTVTLYSKDPTLLRHELGHARVYNESDYPVLRSYGRLLPFGALYDEALASSDATNSILNNVDLNASKEVLEKAIEDTDYANSVLGGAMGTYVGSSVGGLAGGILPMLKPVQKYLKRKNISAKVLSVLPALASGLGILGGAVVGRGIGSYTKPFLNQDSKDKYNQILEKIKQL